MVRILRNKKGQIGETITWVIAIIAIAVMTAASIYIATLISTKPGALLSGKFQMGKEFAQQSSVNLFAQQSFISYLTTSNGSEGEVYQQIINSNPQMSTGKGGLNDFSGPLAAKLFETLYGNYYNIGVFAGVFSSSQNVGNCVMFNTYFKNAGSNIRCSILGNLEQPLQYVSSLNLSAEKSVRLILWRSK